MASGRSPEIAERNAAIRADYDRGRPPAVLMIKYDLSRASIHRIVADPNAAQATQRTPRQVVRALDPPRSSRYAGIAHGTVSGYREELDRGLPTCDDCREANAVVQKRYQDGVRRRLRASRRASRRSRRS